MDGFRWSEVGDGEGKGALFDPDALAERHVGRGEFKGMEFLHVNAKRIISEVPNPKASNMPFRHTVNVYRGCSHACSYCLAGDTPVLMADGRTRPIGEVRKGDLVYGTVVAGAYRRYVVTPVVDQWSTIKPAWRVTLADGTSLVASGDHRFLTGRGWKHVTGDEQGRHRRPHLTLRSKLIGTGSLVQPHPADLGYRRGYLCGLIRGDGHVGSYTYHRSGRQRNEVHRFRLALTDMEALDRCAEYLVSFGVITKQFPYSSATDTRRALQAIRTSRAADVSAIRAITAWPEAPSTSWSRGFLAGIFDAEGSHSRGVLRISNKDGVILSWILRSLQRFGFDGTREPPRDNGVTCVRLRGGLAERLRFFQLTDPAITRKRTISGTALKSDADLRVMAIEPIGLEMPMYDLTTGTGDFIAAGVVSHNCFARPTHEYLGLGIGEDFERRIVVKVNAVERLRAELAARRWAGHHIAMGTNTDPYQRCEGKYHLTQGVVRVLSEAANPFSILTKSTLVLRDLDLLAEAAARTDVRVNLSIGTLDEEVWRLSEPGTPPPRARVEAVRRLNAAGVRCGVLVAPVLPGLSDRDDQLRAVVEACVDAGAVSISGVALHLRPGVREHYLAWLQAVRPELADETASRYRRAYLPKADQQALSARVRAMVAAAERRSPGSRWTSPAASRFVAGSRAARLRVQMGGNGRPAATGAGPGEQLRLGLDDPGPPSRP